ncbi:hypothetical protein [Ekhidna sp.]
MKTRLLLLTLLFWMSYNALSQQVIPLDTNNLAINAKAYVIENYRGVDAIYMQGGAFGLKDVEFLNGTIEFDVFLKEDWAFPGVYFRYDLASNNAEQFFMRPHLSGKPDANQAAPSIQGITPFQLYFGPRYSFEYDYNFDDWTHVKVVVNGSKAQVFLDGAEKPNLSWNLFLPEKAGSVAFRSGRFNGMHIANITVDPDATELVDFNPIEREAIPNLIEEWEISDMFEEKLLADPNSLEQALEDRKWQGKIKVEEGTAANIARIQRLRDGTPGNTVLAKITITSDKDQYKLFEFGYSDRVVAILNGEPIYWGTNKWKSRDYRYLGTVGLFDGVYLNLKKGKNELLMAVSEDFGGWLITGRFKDDTGLKVK